MNENDKYNDEGDFIVGKVVLSKNYMEVFKPCKKCEEYLNLLKSIHEALGIKWGEDPFKKCEEYEREHKLGNYKQAMVWRKALEEIAQEKQDGWEMRECAEDALKENK